MKTTHPRNLILISFSRKFCWLERLEKIYIYTIFAHIIRVEDNGAVKWFELKGILLNVCSVPEYKREMVFNINVIDCRNIITIILKALYSE